MAQALNFRLIPCKIYSTKLSQFIVFQFPTDAAAVSLETIPTISILEQTGSKLTMFGAAHSSIRYMREYCSCASEECLNMSIFNNSCSSPGTTAHVSENPLYER